MKNIAKEISEVLKSAEYKFVIIGAFARDLFFEANNIQLEVGTVDVDFAIFVDTWEDFERVKQMIISELGYSEHSSKVYRLLKGQVPVDLLPFGNIEDGNATIVWPGLSDRMKVMGFREAYKYAVEIDVNGEKIKTVIPELLIALKLSSWMHADRPKDAIDILHILKNANVLCKDVKLDMSLEGSEEENLYKDEFQKVIVRVGLRTINLILKNPDLKRLIQTMFQDSGFNKSKLIEHMNNSSVPTRVKKEQIEYFLNPLISGLLSDSLRRD